MRRLAREEGTAGEAIAVVVSGIILLFVIAAFVAWPFKKVPQSYVGMSYGGGIIEGQHFQGEKVGPTSLFFNGWGDKLYIYPATQRNYIISLHTDEGDRGRADSIVALNADGVPVEYEVAIYFKLNLDKLQAFHENIGIKYHAWCDGGAPNCSTGWENMLNDSFRQQLENALQLVTRQYHTDDFLTTDTVRSIQQAVAMDLKDNVNGVLGDEYFCGPTYIQGTGECPDFKLVLKKPSLPKAVTDRYSEVQESRIEIQTRQNEVLQAEKQAEAIDKLNRALSSAESADAYVLLKAIESGNISFWVIPQDNSLTLQTPTQGTP